MRMATRRAGCPSRCACISTRAATRCACCTPSCSMATSRKDFIRGIGLRFTAPLDATRSTTATCVSPANRTACSAKPCAASPACAAIRARQRARRRSRATPWPSIAPVGQRTCCSTSRPSATGRCCSRTPTPSPSASAPPMATPGSTAAHGARASGLGYFGGPDGRHRLRHPQFLAEPSGAARHPRRAGRRGHASRCGCGRRMRRPMDLRFYHDGLGQDTYEKQYKGGLEITYEDYEPGFGTPMGVARTSELMLWMLPATPARERARRSSREALRTARGHRAHAANYRSTPACSATRSRCRRRRRRNMPQLETAARLDVRLLSRPAGPARLVRLLELRRRHAHL